jgi:hypothetical protein
MTEVRVKDLDSRKKLKGFSFLSDFGFIRTFGPCVVTFSLDHCASQGSLNKTDNKLKYSVAIHAIVT